MEATISGYALVGKNASFAVSISDGSDNTHERIVPLKLKSRYQAELAAIKYVCQAVSHKDVDLVVKTSVSQIPQIFEKTTNGEWPKRKRVNALIDEIRELSDKFTSFKCVSDKNSELMLATKMKAKFPSSI